MIPDKEMDDLFKNRLPGHESPVPDGMWERIVRKKDEDRKGFLFFFRLFGFFILGFGIAGILLFKLNGATKIQPSPEIVHSKESIVADIQDSNSSNKIETVKSSSSQYNTSTASTDSTREKHLKSFLPVGIQFHKNNTHSHFVAKKQRLTDHKMERNDTAGSNQFAADRETTVSTDSNGSGKKTEIPLLDSKGKAPVLDSLKKESAKKSDSTRKTNKAVWSLDIYGSPDYPFVFGQNYEQMRLSYTVGFRLNRSFGKRFSGSIGIQYSEINFYGSDSVGPGLNHLKRLDIPILVGYALDSRTFNTVIHAGLIFNLNTMYQPAFPYYPDYYKTNTGVGVYLGVNFEKHVNSHFSVFGEPYLRFQITSMTNGGPNNYINVTGLSVGLRYYFNK